MSARYEVRAGDQVLGASDCLVTAYTIADIAQMDRDDVVLVETETGEILDAWICTYIPNMLKARKV